MSDRDEGLRDGRHAARARGWGAIRVGQVLEPAVPDPVGEDEVVGPEAGAGAARAGAGPQGAAQGRDVGAGGAQDTDGLVEKKREG